MEPQQQPRIENEKDEKVTQQVLVFISILSLLENLFYSRKIWVSPF